MADDKQALEGQEKDDELYLKLLLLVPQANRKVTPAYEAWIKAPGATEEEKQKRAALKKDFAQEFDKAAKIIEEKLDKEEKKLFNSQRFKKFYTEFQFYLESVPDKAARAHRAYDLTSDHMAEVAQRQIKGLTKDTLEKRAEKIFADETKELGKIADIEPQAEKRIRFWQKIVAEAWDNNALASVPDPDKLSDKAKESLGALQKDAMLKSAVKNAYIKRHEAEKDEDWKKADKEFGVLIEQAAAKIGLNKPTDDIEKRIKDIEIIELIKTKWGREISDELDKQRKKEDKEKRSSAPQDMEVGRLIPTVVEASVNPMAKNTKNKNYLQHS